MKTGGLNSNDSQVCKRITLGGNNKPFTDFPLEHKTSVTG